MKGTDFDAVEPLLKRLETLIEGVRAGEIMIRSWNYSYRDGIASPSSWREMEGTIEWVEVQ